MNSVNFFKKSIFVSVSSLMLSSIAFSSACAATQQLSLESGTSQLIIAKLGKNKVLSYHLHNNGSARIPLDISTSKNLHALKTTNSCDSFLKPFASCDLRFELRAPLKMGIETAQITIRSDKKLLINKSLTLHVTGIPGLKLFMSPQSPVILKAGKTNFVDYQLINASSNPANNLIFKMIGTNIARVNNVNNNCENRLNPGESCHLRFRIGTPYGTRKIKMNLSVSSASGMTAQKSTVLFASSKTVDWQPLNGNGLYSQAISDIAVAPDNSKTAYILSAGIYRTNDGGLHWTKVYLPVLPPYCDTTVTASQVLAGPHGELYAMTNIGLLKSSTGGDIWDNEAGKVPLHFRFSNVILQNGVFYALQSYGDGSVSKLVKRTVGGHSWQTIFEPNLDLDGLVINGNHFYISADNGSVYQSTDAGKTWNKIDALPSIYTYKIVFSKQTAFAEGSNQSSNIFYKSVDGGAHWINLSTTLPKPYIYRDINSYNGALYIFADYGSVFRSTDGGDSWQEIKTTSGRSLNINHYDMDMGNTLIAGIGNTVYVGAASGVYKSLDNGMQWKRMNGGLSANSFKTNSSIVKSNNAILALPNEGGLFSSNDAGANWSESNNGISVPLGLIADGIHKVDNVLYVIGPDCLFRSYNNGVQWNKLSFHPNGYSQKSTFTIDSIAGDGKTLFVAAFLNDPALSTSLSLFKSTDNGLTWRKITTQNKWLEVPKGTHQIIGVKGKLLYDGNYNGLFVSRDSGNTWSKIDPNRLPYDDDVNQILFYKNATFILVSNLLYKSTDGGKSWVHEKVVTNPSYANQLILITQDGANLYVFSNQSLYISTDGGNHWSPLASENLPWEGNYYGDASNTAMIVDGNTFYLATYSSGLLKGELQ